MLSCRSTRGAEAFFGVVEMESLQVRKPNDVVEIPEGLFVAFFRFDVIAGCIAVAGVEANADARFVIHQVDDLPELLETVADGTALAGRVLDHGRHALGILQHFVDGFGDDFYALFFGDLVKVRSRVEVQHLQPELLAALHFVQQRFARFAEHLPVRAAGVDEIAVVRHDVIRGETELVAVFLE